MARRVEVLGDWYHGRVPAGAIYCGRPAPGLPGSKWANPFKPNRVVPATVRLGGRSWPVDPVLVGNWPTGAAGAVAWFRALVARTDLHDAIRAELAGYDLACWCNLENCCHVDVLGEIANGGDLWCFTTLLSSSR